MKTTTITSTIALIALFLLAFFLTPASGKPEAEPEAITAPPTTVENPGNDIPVEHVGMGENRPL